MNLSVTVWVHFQNYGLNNSFLSREGYIARGLDVFQCESHQRGVYIPFPAFVPLSFHSFLVYSIHLK